MFGISQYEVIIVTVTLLLLPFLLVVALFFKALRKSAAGAQPRWDSEETRLVQQIHEDLLRMEKRVEALETLIMDRARENEKEERFR